MTTTIKTTIPETIPEADCAVVAAECMRAIDLLAKFFGRPPTETEVAMVCQAVFDWHAMPSRASH